MSFPFDKTSPATAQMPSVSQPIMLQNFLSTYNILAVDHITFENAAGGQHEQVTFASNNVPAVYSPPTLFTNNDAYNNPQLYYYTTNAESSADQYVASANGSSLFLGGIILKWGASSISAGTGRDVTFASAFPNNCYQVIITVQSASAVTVATVVNSGSVTTTGFQVNSSGNTTISYVAIGN